MPTTFGTGMHGFERDRGDSDATGELGHGDGTGSWLPKGCGGPIGTAWTKKTSTITASTAIRSRR